MSLNASIIEQRVGKLVEDYREQLRPGDEDMLRSKAFVLLTTSVVLDLPLHDALRLVTDGGHDLAIDALHVGDIIEGEFVVTIVQGKYRRKVGGAFPANDIQKVIHTVGILFDPDLQLPHARAEVLARVEEIRSLVRDGNLPSVRVVLCNNGERWNADGDALIRDARLPEEQVTWEHVSHDELVQMIQRPKSVDDELQMVGAAVVEEFDFCRVLLGKVSVRELARLVGAHGDRLLERNIRRYLGLRSNRVNQGISRTLRSRDKRRNFYFFNNGITVTCSKFRHNALQGGSYRVKLEHLQVINGGQTCHTVWRTLEQLPDEDFSQTYVLVRVYELDDAQRDLVHEITYATNSQNPVDLRDLRANDEIQARLELGLRDLGYTYLRKREQAGSNGRTITPTEAAEAVLAVLRRKPHLARFNRSQFFGRLYSEIFADDLTPAQVVRAVELLRIAREQTAALDDPPRYGPYAEHLVAMLMDDELAGMPKVAASTAGRELREVVSSYSLHERALLRVRLLLALDGIDDEVVSLQRLSSAFRRGELANRARTADEEGAKIKERVVAGLARAEQLSRTLLEKLDGLEQLPAEIKADIEEVSRSTQLTNAGIESLQARIADTVRSLAQLPGPSEPD
ncbi:MAG: AIPR family protein [Nannocystaceae bacterium]